MPLEEKRKVHLGVLVHKLKKGNGPSQLIEDYGRSISYHKYHTRSKKRGDMTTLSHNTSKFEKSTIQRATRTWNAIPQELRNIDDTSKFKRAYQSHLLNKYKQDSCT